MEKNKNLTLECTAIGSLPHTDINQAISLIKKDFSKIPFWPQLVKVNRNEDMVFQFLEAMPSFFSNDDKIFLDTDYDTFFEDLEEFYIDFEEITADLNSEKLDKYAVTTSISFNHYLKLIKNTKPQFAKGQVVGPFTLASSLTTKNETAAVYDDTLREIIVKTLSLKALWQIKQIKSANPYTKPIIFIDEPSISQLGTSAYVGVSQDEVISMLTEIIDIIKQNDSISAIHCCGKCDWTIPIKAGVNIINPDAYSFAENLSLFSNEIKAFLNNGGKIAWGIVPTLDKKDLNQTNIDSLIEKFKSSVKYLTKKGIDEKLVIENSLITPSCGAGILSVELSEKAMDLTKLLSVRLKETYNIDD